MTLGEKIVGYRAKNNMSQAEFSRLVKMGQDRISRIENGSNCRKVTERKILDVIEKGE